MPIPLDLEAYVGIDLGTSNSCIAIFRHDHVEIIPNEHGEHTTPSCVAFTDTERLIGLAAKNRSVLDHAGTIRDIKQLMGRSCKDPVTLDATGRLPFKIVNYLGRPAVHVSFKGELCVFTPEQVSAMVLSKLKLMAEDYLGLSADSRIGCVVTVPSTFNINQRQSTLDACTIAGFHVLRAIPEPTAAAFTYNLSRMGRLDPVEKSIYVVFDLGGGTLGITVLEIVDMIVEVLATAGHNQLGGVNFDLRLMSFLADDFDSVHRTSIRSDLRAMSRLRLAAEKAKCVLSSASATTIEIESLYQGQNYSKNITRVILESSCGDIIRSVEPVLDQAFHGARSFSKDSITEVLLVGGYSRIPAIQDIVSKYFNGKELMKRLNPDESAASGAAILADVLSINPRSKISKDVLLLDALSCSIQICGNLGPVPNTSEPTTGEAPELKKKKSGSKKKPVTPRTPPPLDAVRPQSKRKTETISLSSSLCTMFVPKGSTIPMKKTLEISGTVEAEQQTIIVSFYEGERLKAQDNLLLCQFELDVPPTASEHTHYLEVQFDVDGNYDVDFTVLNKRIKEKHVKKIERSVELLSAASLASMQQAERVMRRLDGVDAERTTLKGTLESEAYVLEEKLDRLKLVGSVKTGHEAKSLSRRCLTWLSQNPRATRSEYRAWLEDIRDMLAAIGRSTVDESIDVPIVLPSPDTPERSQTDQYSLISQTSGISLANNHIVSSTPTLHRDEVNSQKPYRAVTPSDSTARPSPYGSAKTTASTNSPRNDSFNSSMSDSTVSTSSLSSQTRLTQLFDTPNKATSSSSKYTDQDMQDISTSLLNMEHRAWSSIPRIYTVLRRTNDLQYIDRFIDHGVTDIWLPFSLSSLPENLPPSVRTRFIETQAIVLTNALGLEKGADGGHVNFGDKDSVPYEILARLGSGGYGHVDKVVSTISRREYARKIFKRRRVFSKHREDIKNFKNELSILKRVSHQHCVELIGSYTDPKTVALIMSPVADCNLATYFVQCASSRDKQSLLRSFYGCLANALAYLHAAKIRHRDIKPENILVKGSRVLLTDFGLSFDWEHLSRSTTTADVARTPVYAAPEVAEYGPRKNSAADVWSLGCVFLEMLTVLRGYTVTDLRAFFKSKNETYKYYDNTDEALEWSRMMAASAQNDDSFVVTWVKMMLCKDPVERATAAAVFADILENGERSGFCGHCCGADDDESSDGTEDGHQAWFDTEEVTIRPP